MSGGAEGRGLRGLVCERSWGLPTVALGTTCARRSRRSAVALASLLFFFSLGLSVEPQPH